MDEDNDRRSSSTSPKRRSKSRSKSPGKHKSRSKSRSKSPGKHKSRSKSRSKSPGKHKSRVRNNSPGGGWWDLENDPELIAALEAEGLRDKERIAQQEELLERRAELVAKFKEQYMKKQQQQNGGSSRNSRGGGLAQRYLQQVQQKERANKPVILDNVRAKPLKIDVFKWEAPKYKKDNEEKTLIKNTARNHFLFKEDQNKEKPKGAAAAAAAAASATATTNATAMIIKAFEPVQYNRGKTIIHQGQKDDHMYVVEDGTVEFQVDDVTVATGGKGTTFGDQNLLYSSSAKASVIAAEPIKIFRLHQDTYRGILQQKHLVEEVKAQKRVAASQQTPPSSPSKRGVKPIYAKDALDNKSNKKSLSSLLDEEWWKNSKRVQLQIAIRDALRKIQQHQLERIRVLGEGQFGEVWLVAADIDINKDRTFQKYEFALKLQSTHDEMREELAVEAIKMEIQAMKDLSDHPFVSTLYKSYETEESMDMVLGLIPGGELWDVIHKENEATGEWFSGIAEGDARFYSMVVADTLGYLHNRNYIFRDLKPENIMIDNKGYPVVVDFGFCKHLPKGARKDKSFTFCGTPNYVSPEIVRNAGHNAAADYWALGILLFEMIEGENPFYYDDMEQMELYRSICEDPPEKIDEKVHSKQVRELVNDLLEKDPKKRIGTQYILTHSWYDGLSLKKLRARKIKAPWVPPSSGSEEDEDEDDDDEERERQRRQEEELQRLEQEELQRQEERRRRQQQEMEEVRRKEKEEEELRRRKQRQRELEEEQRRREEEEDRERQRLEKMRIQREKEEEERRRRVEEEEEAAHRAEEEEKERRRLEQIRLQKEREAEERRRRKEEEEERRRLDEEERRRQEEEGERQRLEELRIQKELEEQRRREEEEERQRLEVIRLQKEREEKERRRLEEEERRRLEEEERQRLEELRIQEELEEQRRREEEAEAARKAEEKERRRLEKQRLQREREEEERRRKEEEENRLEELRIQKELEEQRRREEEEELEKQAEAERIAAEEARLRALEEERIAQERAEEEARLLEDEERQRRNKEKEPQEEMELDDVFTHNNSESMPEAVSPGRGADRGERVRSLHQSYNGFSSPGKSPRRSIEDLISPVPKGIVAKLVNAKKSPSGRQTNPAKVDARKAGLVAKRLSAAKKKEKPENIPSLFSSFSLFDD